MRKKYVQDEIVRLAKDIRISCLNMIACSGSSHIGSNLSVADLLAHLYGYWLNVQPSVPDWEGRDRFILSKGHAAASLYSVLAHTGFFETQLLDRYCEDGSPLYGHISHHSVAGIEFSTGSLGHGLSLAAGMALGLKRSLMDPKTVVLLSDGECDEGSTWEAALFAAHHRLEKLIAIVDYNKIQAMGHTRDVLNLEPFAQKWEAFGWTVKEIDGHSHEEIHAALSSLPFGNGKPSVLIAHTVKGKGISFMEDKLLWHYRSPRPEELAQARKELEGERHS
jgi:transketolase